MLMFFQYTLLLSTATQERVESRRRGGQGLTMHLRCEPLVGFFFLELVIFLKIS
jgi:hypothetical protein